MSNTTIATLTTLALTSSLIACSSRAPQVISLAQPAPAAEHKPGEMAVTGTATLEVSPDCADLTMTITAEAQRPGAAGASVQTKERELVAELGKLGVTANDLKLSYVTLDPVYEVTAKGLQLPQIRAYRAAITMTATTRQFDRIGAIMEAGSEHGATSLSSAFRRSDLSALKKQVRDMALTATRDKAKQTADGLGIKLGRVTSVAENAGGQMWSQQYFPANAQQTIDASAGFVGTMQPLTLTITVGYELATET